MTPERIEEYQEEFDRLFGPANENLLMGLADKLMAIEDDLRTVNAKLSCVHGMVENLLCYLEEEEDGH